MAGAFPAYFTGKKLKKAGNLCACVICACETALLLIVLASCALGYEAELTLSGALGAGLSFGANGFGLVFACVCAYMWLMTTLFSADYLSHSENTGRYYFFLLITLGATVGVFLSADLFTAFVCFEIMSMASYVCVVHEENDGAMRAGGVYLAVAVIGGLAALMGIFILYFLAGTLEYESLYAACRAAFEGNEAWFYIAGGCILFGFGAKAGIYPLHIWLPLAHPVAPAPASALLSGIITKTGIFGVIIISTRVFLNNGYWGFVVLIFGIATAFMGGVLAVFSVDLKHTLACSSMSQLGFIFTGIGMMDLLGEEGSLAVRGVVLHMFNHSNLKLVLFMAAGVVLMKLHNGNLNNIRGYGRKKPLLMYSFLAGSLGISGIPLFNGYISKTLIHESIVEYIELLKEGTEILTFAAASGEGAVILFKVIEWLFLITGGMTAAYMTKLFVVIFVEKNEDAARQAEFDSDKKYAAPLTKGVLALSASIVLAVGFFPYFTQDIIADFAQGFFFEGIETHTVRYFTWTNLKGALISVIIGALIYFLIIRGCIMRKSKSGAREYAKRWPEKFALLTLVYEPVVMKILPAIGAFFARCLDFAPDGIVLLLRKTTHKQHYERELPPVTYKRAYYIGKVFDFFAELLNKTVRRRHPKEHNFVFRFSIRQKTRKTFASIVSASVSFGFMMFAVGVVIVVVYLLIF